MCTDLLFYVNLFTANTDGAELSAGFWGIKGLRGAHSLTGEAYRLTGKLTDAMTEAYSCTLGALRSGLSRRGWSAQASQGN